MKKVIGDILKMVMRGPQVNKHAYSKSVLIGGPMTTGVGSTMAAEEDRNRPIVEQLDSMLFGIANVIVAMSEFVAIVNWLNFSELRYTLKLVGGYNGILVKFEDPAAAVAFKLAHIESDRNPNQS